MRDFPDTTTWPSGSNAGALDRSKSRALSDGHDEGAKNWTRESAGESSRTESLSSYAWLDDVTEPLPTETQMLPAASITGAAPPIHTAPWLSPGPESTPKLAGVPPASGMAITQ